MIRFVIALLALFALPAAALAQQVPPDIWTQAAGPSSANNQVWDPQAGGWRSLTGDAMGALAPPAAAAGKIIETDVSLTTATNTPLVAALTAPAKRVGIAIQCNGGPVKISEIGSTLTSAVIGTGPSGKILPSANTLYIPLEGSQTAYTAYQATGATVTCAVTDYRL